MNAGRLNFRLPINGTWKLAVRYKKPDPVRQQPNRRTAVDLSGWHAVLQARAKEGANTTLFTASNRVSDTPTAAIPTLGTDGEVSWAINMEPLTLPERAVYELVLIDPDGHPMPFLRGQIEFEPGIVDL